MKMRALGRSGLEIRGPLAFGGNVFGWTADEDMSFRLLDAFVDAGFNFIDTADVYARWAEGNAGGESETIIGRWLQRGGAGKREKVTIATKVGNEMGPGRKGLKPDYIYRAVEDSLRRLQTDVIDLYQSHKDDPETPQEETLNAYARLIEQGKVRAIGASNFSAARLSEALRISREHGWPRYESLQPHYNLVERRGYEEELEPLCVGEGLGVIPYYALAAGFLTGKYRSEADLAGSARAKMVRPYMTQRGMRIVAALDEVAERVGGGATPARVAIAWLIHRPGITAPIVSATSERQFTELVEATRLELSAEDLRRLDEASAWNGD